MLGLKSLLSAIFSLIISSLSGSSTACAPGRGLVLPRCRARQQGTPGSPWTPTVTCTGSAAGRAWWLRAGHHHCPPPRASWNAGGPRYPRGILRPGGEEVLVPGSLENGCF